MNASLDEVPTLLLRSRGDMAAGVVVPPRQQDRLAVLLSFTAAGGQPVQIELALGDVGCLAGDLVQILAADADRTCRWWYKLTADDRRPGLLPQAAHTC